MHVNIQRKSDGPDSRASLSGFALLEAIIAAGITTLLVLVMCSFT
jgi:hypothetical protein